MKALYNKITKYSPIILLSIFATLLYIVLLLKSQDNDMFFEIMSGRDILNGNFRTVSHLNNFPIIVQQWLYAVCLSLIDRFGRVGDVCWVLFQNAILYVVSYIFIKLKTNDKKKALISPAFILLFCHDYMINIRPQIITMIMLITELIFIELYKKKNSIKYLLPIFPLLILYANFHQAVFLYSGFVMIPYLIQPKKPYIDWKLTAFTPFFMACSLLTPYGLDGSLYIVRTFMSDSFKLVNINELGPIGITSYPGIKLVLVLAVTIVYTYLHKSNYFVNFYVFAISFLAFVNIRHVSILYLAVMFLICTIEDFHLLNNKYVYYGLAAICMTLSLLFVSIAKDISYKYGKVEDAIEDKSAPIYNVAMDLGGWLEYNGCTHVTLDSRCEAFSEEISGVPNVLENYILLSRGHILEDGNPVGLASDEEVLDVIKDYKYVVSLKMQYVDNVLSRHSDKWDLIFENSKYNVYIQHE